jgi:hypothetical protein
MPKYSPLCRTIEDATALAISRRLASSAADI